MAVVENTILGAQPAFADELAVLAATLQRSTVHVRSRGGSGSGVIWQPDGLIVTNAHVARGSHAEIELSDGRKFEGEVVGRDPDRDLAALVVDARDLPAGAVADSSALRVGQLVVAVGNPLGMTGALTTGIVHAIAPAEGRGRQNWVQADVRLWPGNSGGPLADVEGRVIGVNSMVAGGLGLAVPSNAVERFLGSRGHRAQLGVALQPVMAAGRPGMLVLEVMAGSPAERAGLLIGDVLLAVNGVGIDSGPDIGQAIQDGGTVHLALVRAGQSMTLDALLESEPAREAA